jgi:uncharacterized protein
MSKLIKILSIDGGGIRGIIPGQILIYIENKFKEKTGNPDARIADYFDFFAGTSTGGILTCALLCPGENGRPLFSAEQVADLYLKHGTDIFSRSTTKKMSSLGGMTDEKYSESELEKALENYFKDIKLSQLLRPCLITSYEIERRYAHFFTQHDAISKPGYDFFIRDVSRATSAAPTYFEAAKIKSTTDVSYTLVDGGVFANNPSLCAFCEANELFKKDKPVPVDDILLLSLGTGNVKRSYDYDIAKDWGKVGWVRPVLDIMMSGVSETVEFQMGQLFSSMGKPEQYIRINPNLGQASSDLDNASVENINALKEAGIYCAESNYEKLDKIVDRLLEE